MTATQRYPLYALALAAMVLGSGLASQPTAAQERVGVNSAVNQTATGSAPGGAARRLVLGQEVVFNERITTGEGGQTQVLFLDESTMSVGPNSDMVIDEFVYDPRAGTGKLAANLTRGVFRFVGGKLSKQDNAVTMQTPSATIGIRGGLILVNLTPTGQLSVILGYGVGVTVTGLNGVAQTITRPGFQVTVSGRGAAPSEPSPAPPGAAAALLAQLDGRPGGNGGARTIPTDTMVANSNIASTTSINLTAAQAQTQQSPSIGSTVRDAIPPNSFQNTATQPATQTSAQQIIAAATSASTTPVTPTPTPPPPSPPPPVTINYAGLFKSTNGNAATNGFVDQSAAARIPYADGTLANGVLTTALGGVGPLTIPLGPGSQTFGAAGTSSPLGPVTGTSFMSSDGTFFYANLTPVNTPTQREFVFGGKPVNQSFFAPTSAVRIFAFTVQPDAALQSPIPFITNNAGGNLANPTVSPFYVVAPPNSAFGSFNPNTNPSGTAPRTLQASLAINGQGVNQSSVLVVGTGTIATSSDTGTVVADGGLLGSFQANGLSRPVRISSAMASVPDGNNNNLFGGNTISGFVLDQNNYTGNVNFQQQLAAQVPLGSSATNYAFTQPVTATALPSNVGTSRTTQTLNGFYGGIMSPQTVGVGFGSPYVTTGNATVMTSAASNRVFATFSSTDTSATGSPALTLNFGSRLTTSRDFARSAFVDDSNFAARESADIPSQVNGVNIQLNGDPTQASRIAMVTSNTVASTSLLPAGVSYCQCQYLQWGYWTGELDTPNAAGTSVTRRDVAHINTWIGGALSPVGDLNTLAMQGATFGYQGHLIGTVFNNGAQYLAAGGLNTTYNFATQTGAVSVANYDGRSFTATGSAPRSGQFYTFNINNPPGLPLGGTINGAFYGPMAAETGGNFSFHSTAGPTYLTSGIFAAKR